MTILGKLTALLPNEERGEPRGSLHVVDPHPLNWLYITYNTCEELTRVEPSGSPAPAAMSSYVWVNHRTLEVTIRHGEQFADGELLTAANVKRSLDEAMRWKAPHPPGTQFNLNLSTECEIAGDHTLRLHFAQPDGFALAKLRNVHIMTPRFWEDLGFGYKRTGSGEGHWSMLDEPGAWSAGPFTLTEGHCSIANEEAVIRQEPLAATWLPVREDRTPVVRLSANTHYWDRRRGPHVREIIFRNDIPPEQALESVCTTEGEVDLVTDIPPSEARRVESSQHAKLVEIDALQIVVGIINRNAEGLPLTDRRARLALNLAIDRDRIIRRALFGRADPLGGFTPPAATHFLYRLPPYPHQAERACDLWEEVDKQRSRALRIATPAKFEPAAQIIAANLHEALRLDVEVNVIRDAQERLREQRKLVEKREPLGWDIFLQQQGIQTADSAALELHRAFVGETGEFRAGPVVPAFETIYREVVAETSAFDLAKMTHRLDKYAFDEAFALFLYAPHALYAVNKHVEFTPYRTTFEPAQTKVTDEHWSLRAG